MRSIASLVTSGLGLLEHTLPRLADKRDEPLYEFANGRILLDVEALQQAAENIPDGSLVGVLMEVRAELKQRQPNLEPCIGFAKDSDDYVLYVVSRTRS